jgi:hypothetical protein
MVKIKFLTFNDFFLLICIMEILITLFFDKFKVLSVLLFSLRTKSVQMRTSARTSKRTVRTLLSVQRVHFIKKHLLR